MIHLIFTFAYTFPRIKYDIYPADIFETEKSAVKTKMCRMIKYSTIRGVFCCISLGVLLPAAIFKIAKTLGARLLSSSVLKVRDTAYNIVSYWVNKIFVDKTFAVQCPLRIYFF